MIPLHGLPVLLIGICGAVEMSLMEDIRNIQEPESTAPVNRSGEFIWASATRQNSNNRTVEGPEPGMHPFCDNCTGNVAGNSTRNVTTQLPEDYPAACKVEGYPQDWLGPKGCNCKNKCFQQNFSDPLSEKVCHTVGLCFGKITGACIKTAQDANATADCHKSCGTCSPGRDLDGTPSATGCRTCKSDSTGWMPTADPNCAMGNQQGTCRVFPSPKQQCQVKCSPRTLTADGHVQVTKSAAPENELSFNNGTNGTHNLPTLVCNKLCTVGLPLRFNDSIDVIAFCTVSKEVTCRQQEKDSNETQPTLRCNSAKTTRFVGWQRYDDSNVLSRAHSFQDDKMFYTSEDESVSQLVQSWQSLPDEATRIVEGKVSPTPPTAESGGADFVTYTALNTKTESDLCLTHSLVS